MPQYKNASELESGLADMSKQYFENAVSARERGDDYVRVAVFLATVLFLTALSQRFTYVGPRAVVVSIAAILLLVGAFWTLTLPRM